MKMNLGTPEGKTYTIELDEVRAKTLIGKRIGDVIDGNDIGLPGYKIKLTGGSDSSGFPMRSDVSGSRKVKILLSKGPGIRTKRKGERRKKMVRGAVYSEEITQVNAMVIERSENAVNIEDVAKKKEGGA